MPKLSKRRRAGSENWNKRFIDDDSRIDANFDINNNEVGVSSVAEVLEDLLSISVETQTDVKFRSFGTQTTEDSMNLYNYKRKAAFKEQLSWHVISTLLDLFRSYNPFWNAIHERVLSVILYLVFRILGYSFKEADEFLKKVHCYSAKVAHEWSESVLINKDEPTCLFEDKRGIITKSNHSLFLT